MSGSLCIVVSFLSSTGGVVSFSKMVSHTIAMWEQSICLYFMKLGTYGLIYLSDFTCPLTDAEISACKGMESDLFLMLYWEKKQLIWIKDPKYDPKTEHPEETIGGNPPAFVLAVDFFLDSTVKKAQAKDKCE